MQDQYINLRVDRKFKREIEKHAKKEERPVGSLIKVIVKEWMARQK